MAPFWKTKRSRVSRRASGSRTHKNNSTRDVKRSAKNAALPEKSVRARKTRRIIKSGFVIRRPISQKRLERALQVLSDTKELKAAARAIRVSPETFKRTAKRKRAIQKNGDVWTVAKRLSRRMPIYSDRQLKTISVSSKSASQIGSYMTAVKRFLKTNDPQFLAKFQNVSIKDTSRKSHVLETDPNTLYRLASTASEPFESVYRIII